MGSNLKIPFYEPSVPRLIPPGNEGTWTFETRIDVSTGLINALKKSTKLTSHGFRPQSRQNEISDISPGQTCVIQIEMSNSSISCAVNGERRSS